VKQARSNGGDMKRLSILFIAFVLCFNVVAQVQVEKTVPEKVELSDIREFVINVTARTIDIHLENGKSYTLDRQPFLVFWNSLTSTQRNVIKGFIRECIKLAADVTDDKVTGDFGE
jgi:hypothetical protein